MRGLVRGIVVALFALGASQGLAEGMMIDDFTARPETRWRFFADTVMGGVSSGKVSFVTEGGRTHARMTGTVSTANNGGFIQMRLDMADAGPDGATGVRLVVRGNDQRYFVHLRTDGTVLPWQYYQAGFDVTRDWAEVRLPFSTFEPSGALLRDTLRADRLTSIGVVAFGRDHEAMIEVREVGFY
ncbi:MAG: NADH ubiquinone oxidoreductase [Rhodobacteraceae bacterium]|nr:NADH ubiquinone oxidoreductase [Paracoccaceae bacterium]